MREVTSWLSSIHTLWQRLPLLLQIMLYHLIVFLLRFTPTLRLTFLILSSVLLLRRLKIILKLAPLFLLPIIKITIHLRFLLFLHDHLLLLSQQISLPLQLLLHQLTSFRIKTKITLQYFHITYPVTNVLNLFYLLLEMSLLLESRWRWIRTRKCKW